MMATGGLMGIKTGAALLLGALVNYLWLAPWMIELGDIQPKVTGGAAHYGFRQITQWSLWCGVAMMTAASLVAFFARPGMIAGAFSGLLRRKRSGEDVLRDIELPMKVFFVGIPVVGAIVVFLGHAFFGIEYWLGALAVPLVFVFALIAAHSTALTAITPIGAMGKLTQLTYGVLAPGNMTTNIMTAGITAEVTSNASNLLMDIKPGYMLGAKPRQQAIAHLFGICAGALTAVPVFYLVFLRDDPSRLASDQYPMPSATVWKAVAEVLTRGLENIPVSARWAALAGVVLGVLLESAKVSTKGRFWLSGVPVGLAFVIPFSNSLSMFLGSFFFWAASRACRKPGAGPHRVLVQNQETLCAGLIAGGAIMGIAVIVIKNFLLVGS
ncbi:MAG: OPT/YSL family transporter [Planctomycetes bacterium]|nr:OPT/YSL family transporter [Planctomycetota bacterium]